MPPSFFSRSISSSWSIVLVHEEGRLLKKFGPDDERSPPAQSPPGNITETVSMRPEPPKRDVSAPPGQEA